MLLVPYYRPKVCIWSKTVYKVNLQASKQALELKKNSIVEGKGGGCHFELKCEFEEFNLNLYDFEYCIKI